MKRTIEGVTRAVYGLAATCMLMLSLALVGDGVYQVIDALRTGAKFLDETILDSVGNIVVAIAVFDVARYLIEEEVIGSGEHVDSAVKIRKSLIRFISVISIAVFLDGLVTIFKANNQDLTLVVYPAVLLTVGVVMIVGLAVFQRLVANVGE